MFYRLDVDGERKQIVIKAENAVIASCIVSEMLDYRGVEYDEFQIFPSADALKLLSKEYEFYEVWARK